jgi:hypothetical protein
VPFEEDELHGDVFAVPKEQLYAGNNMGMKGILKRTLNVKKEEMAINKCIHP